MARQRFTSFPELEAAIGYTDISDFASRVLRPRV